MNNKENKKKIRDDKSHTHKGLTKKEEVPVNTDEHIDEDFPGFPHSPAREKTIKPQTEEDKVNANLNNKNEPSDQKNLSLGSANAFEATENEEILREELDNDNKGEKRKSNY